MGFINSLESRHRWLAFPSLLRGLAIIHFIMVLMLMAKPALGITMAFDWSKILSGEIWRLVSFLFLVSLPHPDTPAGFDMLPLPVLFAFFALMIAFLFNDSLENTWGVWRTSVYLYLVIFGQIFANILLSISGLIAEPVGGSFIYMAAFFAFATLFPKHTFLLMLIIPVQVRFLAALAGFFIIVSAFNSLSFAIFVLLTFLPYLWWAFPMALKAGKNKNTIAKRRVEFLSQSKATTVGTFHSCKKCGATEVSHPNREFRVVEDGEEICNDCLES